MNAHAPDRRALATRPRLHALWHRVTPRLLDAACLGVLALYLAAYVARHSVHQGDLRTYLAAARAALAGLDPYAPGVLDTLVGRHVMPFVYPPAALLAFVPLALLPAKAVMSGWMWAKVAALAALVFVWSRRYVPDASLVALALVTLWGANRAAHWDLYAGNVAIFECALLYAGFACWSAGARGAFAVFVVAASLCKLTPAVFLLLLLVPLPGAPARPRLFVAALAALAATVALPMLAGPAARWTPFFAHMPDATTYTDSNPSSLGFFTVAALALRVPGELATHVGRLAWLAFVAGLLFASRTYLRDLWHRQDATRWILSAVLFYVVVHPRVMAYGYVLAVPAMLYFAPRRFTGRVGGLVLALLLSAQGLAQQLTGAFSGSLFVLYAPWLMSLAVWLLATAAPAAQAVAEHESPARAA